MQCECKFDGRKFNQKKSRIMIDVSMRVQNISYM